MLFGKCAPSSLLVTPPWPCSGREHQDHLRGPKAVTQFVMSAQIRDCQEWGQGSPLSPRPWRTVGPWGPGPAVPSPGLWCSPTPGTPFSIATGLTWPAGQHFLPCPPGSSPPSFLEVYSSKPGTPPLSSGSRLGRPSDPRHKKRTRKLGRRHVPGSLQVQSQLHFMAGPPSPNRAHMGRASSLRGPRVSSAVKAQ